MAETGHLPYPRTLTRPDPDQIDRLRTAIDVLVRVLKITDALTVESAQRLNPPDVQTLLFIRETGTCIAADISRHLGAAQRSGLSGPYDAYSNPPC